MTSLAEEPVGIMEGLRGRCSPAIRRGRAPFLALCEMLVLACAGLLHPVAAQSSQPVSSSPDPIISVSQVRFLDEAEAAKARPVRLQGVVTAVSGWKTSFFFQDGTAGISVDGKTDLPAVETGQKVEVIGVTGPGEFAPVVLATSVIVVGKSSLPAPLPLDLVNAADGNLDSQWVEATGTIVSASVRPSWGRSVLFLDLHIGNGTIVSVRVHDFSAGSWRSLPGSSVSVKGVCGTVFNDKRQIIGLQLFLSNLNDLHVLRKAPADPFAYPLQRIPELHRFAPDRPESELVRVRGIVTYPAFLGVLYMQDGPNGMAVRATEPIEAGAGTAIEAVGLIGHGEYSPSLEHARLRIVPASLNAIPAQPAVAAEMIGVKNGFSISPHDSQLVQLKGTIIETAPGTEEDILFIRDGNSVFTARLPRRRNRNQLPAVGTYVRITGVCETRMDTAHEAKSFRLLLRTADDIVVLKGASWWNIAHATVVAEVLGGALILMTAFLFVTHREAALRHLSLTDSLTGLYNRRGFIFLANHQWQLAVRKRSSMLLFYIDVDQFKQINDTLGHKKGDLALNHVASILRETFRKADVVARLGGDEFAVAAIEASPDSQQEIERRLTACIQKANQEPGCEFNISLSVGVLLCDAALANLSMEELLSRADSLMYVQKRARSH